MAKILIVEDDPVMRRLLAKALEPLGLDLHHCSDGIHALDALRCNDCFDLIITDISMPVLDGRQLVSTLVHDKNLPNIPVLIMSGVVGVNEIADLLDLGATKFIPKPFNMQTLRDDVASCLNLSCPLPA
jgi:CheY-like chemotaxis protein